MSDAWNCDEVKRRILNLEAEVKALRNAVVTEGAHTLRAVSHREMRPAAPSLCKLCGIDLTAGYAPCQQVSCPSGRMSITYRHREEDDGA